MVDGEEQSKKDGNRKNNSSSSSSIVIVKEEEEGNEERTQEQQTTNISKSSDSNAKPSWFTSTRLLAIFCVINLLTYLDRGAIASIGVNGSKRTCDEAGKCTGGNGIQGQFELTDFQDGIIASAFLVGLLVASPIFAVLAKSVNPFRLIGVGMLVWTIALVGCGFSWDFWSISTFRMLVGVGEASFGSLSAPFIDDHAPDSQRTAWLGYFYMCIPVGYALGYVYGGLVGGRVSWRWAFFIQGIVMVPFVVLGFIIEPLQLKGFEHVGAKQPSSVGTNAPQAQGNTNSLDDDTTISKGNGCTRFLIDMKLLLLEKVYVVSVLGYIVYSFVLGAFSYWGPKAAYSLYNLTNADMIFGAITLGCGLSGTISGGLLLDYVNSTVSNGFKILSTSMFFGSAFTFGAFCFKSKIVFLIFCTIGQFFLFATQAPACSVCLHGVKASLRPLAMAVITVAIHVLGDVPSSPLLGYLQDHTHNWRTTCLSLTAMLFLSAFIWFIGIFLRSNYENENAVTTANITNRASWSEEA